MIFTKASHEGYWESHIIEVLDEQGDWHKALIINEPRDYVEVVNGKKFTLSETRIRITPIV